MSTERREVRSRTGYEDWIGYCRAVRTGPLVTVAGTVATEPDGTVTDGDAGVQTVRIFEIISEALASLDASMDQVVRIRIFVVDMNDWAAVAEVVRGSFGDSRPTATLVEVTALMEPSMLVEIEMDAWSPLDD